MVEDPEHRIQTLKDWESPGPVVSFLCNIGQVMKFHFPHL